MMFGSAGESENSDAGGAGFGGRDTRVRDPAAAYHYGCYQGAIIQNHTLTRM